MSSCTCSDSSLFDCSVWDALHPQYVGRRSPTLRLDAVRGRISSGVHVSVVWRTPETTGTRVKHFVVVSEPEQHRCVRKVSYFLFAGGQMSRS